MNKEIIVVSGASSGIGKTIGTHLKEKYHVINISRTKSNFDDILCDISDDVQLNSTIDRLYQVLEDERIKYLINNAGIMPLEPDGTELYNKVMNTNLRAAYILSTRLADWIDGGIINIASVSALGPSSSDDSIAYGISKSGIVTLTKYLAIKYPKLCINAISPGYIKVTNLVPGDTPQELINEIPKKREGTTDEIANLVEYLMSQKYATGQNICFDGGLSL